MDHLLFKVSLHIILSIYMYRNLPFTGVHTFMVMLFTKRIHFLTCKGKKLRTLLICEITSKNDDTLIF